jgi:hypothetical protein
MPKSSEKPASESGPPAVGSKSGGLDTLGGTSKRGSQSSIGMVSPEFQVSSCGRMRIVNHAKLILLLIALGILSTVVFAWSHRGIERHATSWIKTEFEDGDVAFTTVNQRWSLKLHYWPDGTHRSLLLLEEFRNRQRLHIDLGVGIVKVTAWCGRDTRPTHKMWTIEHEGDEGKLSQFDPFYVIIYDGGCDPAEYFYYNLVHGRNVYTATEDLLEIIIPESDLVRYIAYQYTREAVPPSYEKREESDIPFGIIRYGSEGSVIQTLVVRARRKWMITYPDKLKFLHGKKLEESPLMLFDVRSREDKSALSDFSLVISLALDRG